VLDLSSSARRHFPDIYYDAVRLNARSYVLLRHWHRERLLDSAQARGELVYFSQLDKKYFGKFTGPVNLPKYRV
jgi:hypothetical protein